VTVRPHGGTSPYSPLSFLHPPQPLLSLLHTRGGCEVAGPAPAGDPPATGGAPRRRGFFSPASALFLSQEHDRARRLRARGGVARRRRRPKLTVAAAATQGRRAEDGRGRCVFAPEKETFSFGRGGGTVPSPLPCSSTSASACRCALDREERRGLAAAHLFRRARGSTGEFLSFYFDFLLGIFSAVGKSR
jgi:hypothetical protein